MFVWLSGIRQFQGDWSQVGSRRASTEFRPSKATPAGTAMVKQIMPTCGGLKAIEAGLAVTPVGRPTTSIETGALFAWASVN